MSLHKSFYHSRKKWYNNEVFPLVPIVGTTKADKYNASHFSFSWLFIKIWSLESFEFEIALVANSHFGIGVTAIIPFLRLVFAMPFSEKFAIWIAKHLNRTPSEQ